MSGFSDLQSLVTASANLWMCSFPNTQKTAKD